jgi:hypothetical protein
VKRSRFRLAVVLTAAALPAACEDAETIIAVYSPRSEIEAGPDVAPAGDAEAEAEAPDADAGAGGSAAVPTAFYLEAEDGVLSGPLVIGTSEQASGGEFISASEPATNDATVGNARALYEFALEEAGVYVIWGRIHSPDAISNRFWVTVDDGEWFLWRISTGEAWFWDDFHDNTDYNQRLSFMFAAGAHRLELANAVMGAELDRLYITARNDHPPGNTTPCNPPHSIETQGMCRPSCGSYGEVSCLSDVCMGLPELDAYDCPVCCLPP